MQNPLYAGIVVNKKLEATDKIFTYAVPEVLKNEISCGMAVIVPFGKVFLEGIVVELYDKTAVTGLKNIKSILGDKPLFDAQMLTLSRFVADYYLCPWSAALQAMLPAGMTLTGKLPASQSVKCCYVTDIEFAFTARQKKQSAAYEYIKEHNGISAIQMMKAGFADNILRTLAKKNYIRIVQERIFQHVERKAVHPVELSDEQQQALTGLLTLWHGSRQTSLLYGITGSGKTEIYLRLMEQVLKEKKQVLLLVPEIALTPQMVDNVSRRLAIQVAVLHSGMTSVERRIAWQDIAEGKFSVVLGARSAVFAPLQNLGLIIIDEEQEASYKQENAPRFHARTVAAKRVELCNGMLLLGSATPATESYFKAQNGQYAFFELTKRFHQPLLPATFVVDMREELAHGNRSSFSALLREKIATVLEHDEQVLLFLNRRGFFTFYSCRACGKVIKCPHCEVPLAFHENEGLLKCHYCGHSEELPSLCPQCGSRAIRHFGTGTQRIAAEVQKLFPQAKILRLDRDVTVQRGAHEQIYRQMAEHRADILVGTQMIAKGLDFPLVTLAAVMAADTTLNLPSWRAGEQTFQLLTQLIGRSGRRDKRGEAVIQTYSPFSHIIATAAKQDYDLFYEKEIMMRELAEYPPFYAMIKLLFTSPNSLELVMVTDKAAGYLKTYLDANAVLCGPAPAPIEKIKDRWRRQILLKGADLSLLRDAVVRMQESLNANKLKPRSVSILIDVDPLD